MSEPITCRECGGINWTTEWRGSFTEDLDLEWQSHVATPTYELKFNNEDQFDTDTDPWKCSACGVEADEEQADAIYKLTNA